MTIAIRDREAERLTLQDELDALKTPSERNKLGQFATPTKLADEILRFARLLTPAEQRVRFLDPALGTGSFYAALQREFEAAAVDSAVGYEVDHVVADAAKELWRTSSLEVVATDFMGAMPGDDAARLPNLVICNPPYVRHHHLDRDAKASLQGQVFKSTGRRLSGLAGLYCYFLLQCHSWMADDGLALWLVPSEFLDVNYGRVIKQYLLDDVTLLRVHRFDPNDLQFDDALVSSVVVCFKKGRPSANHTAQFTYGGSLSRPTMLRSTPVTALRTEAKWTGLATKTSEAADAGAGTMRLRDVFDIKRGLATGSNDFFILNEEKAAKLELPAEFLQPILPSPRHLASDEVEADENGLPKVERRLFLLNCRLGEKEIEGRFPKLWAYLAAGIVQGVHEGYLSLHRSPWYAQEDRPASPFLTTYMSRQDGGGSGFRFILNRSKATAANVYLMLYPKGPLARALKERPELGREMWLALKEITAATLVGNGRVYGGGLHKLEPRELGNVPADTIVELVPAIYRSYAEQIALL
jgi:adenine-specific DNA-methyltransferase